ncbi:MAG TPA: universal stress protein [Candidatus Limnocylindria bacterium]|jgi:nucleotide-binding universal stress UspA family protein|nr:universal stress protein [Candidatus Limnocylindria bacterium]
MITESSTRKARPQTRAIFERILVPTDGSLPARTADAVAIGLAQALHGRVRFVLVLDTERLTADLTMGTERDVSDVIDHLRPVGQAVLDEVVRRAAAAGVHAESALLEGDVVDRILEEAVAWHADAIVIGTHARPHAFAPALGSKTHELLRRSSIPVLVCR